MEIKAAARAAAAAAAAGGRALQRVYFVGCGGSLGALYPAKSLIERESLNLTAGWINSGEFITATPKGVDLGAVVLVVSHQGNTPETVRAAKIASERGAYVIGLSYAEEPEMAKHCRHVLSYTFGEGRDTAGEKVMVALRLAAELVDISGGFGAKDDFYSAVDSIDAIAKAAAIKAEGAADAFAHNNKDAKFIYTLGSGAGWGAAYMQSICIFMEMQWINSACIHSGEFFHGPFEITEPNVPFMAQISAGDSRALDRRAADFLSRYGGSHEIIDAEVYGLSALPDTVVDYFNHSLFSQIYHVYNKKLAEIRNHPLSTRRYMHIVEY